MNASRTPGNEAAIADSIRRAMALAQAGRLRDAIAGLQNDRGVLGHPGGCNMLGVLHMQAGEPDAALRCFDRAVGAAPDFADGHCNRGVVLQQAGRLDDALAAYDRTLRVAPDHPNALFNRGIVLRLLGRPDEALAAFDRVLATQPRNAEALLKRAYLRSERGDYAAALEDFARVLGLDPPNLEAAFGRVSTLVALGRLAEALEGIDRIVAAQPASADAQLVRGQILVDLDREAEALAAIAPVVASGRGGAKVAILQAALSWRTGRRDEAIAILDAVARSGTDDVQVQQAMAQYLLAVGDFHRGWVAYEHRGDSYGTRHSEIETRAPRWTGGDIAGKTILVCAEQGIGDTLQFVRFLAPLRAREAEIRMLVQPVLLRLMESLPVSVAWFDSAADVGAVDFQIPLLSLPRVFGTTLETIPGEVPYLFAEPARVADWRARIGQRGFRIGVVWQGNPKYKNDRRRSAPLRHYAALAGVPGVRLISLQAAHGLDQLDDLPEGMAVEMLGDRIAANPDGISEIAAAMASLDLVVTSDTAIAHLAGALGHPVWVALSDDPDWRWMIGRDDSPWYPTMRLFRQKVRGDWAGVFAEIAAAADAMARR